METVEHLRHLYTYNDWANRRILVAVKSSGSERCRQILAHLLITEMEYYERLFGKDSTGFNFWPDLTVEDCGELARATSSANDLKHRDEGGNEFATCVHVLEKRQQVQL